jgi:hypothetical protein
MTEIHYFQRYSQLENVITNNTLLLFSRVYQDSPRRLEQFLNLLVDDENLKLSIGPVFKQQVRGENSVPDGSINQSSMKIVIEAKLYGNAGSAQLINHLDAFEGEDRKILLLVDTTEPPVSLVKEVKAAIRQKNIGVQFLSTTFRDICKSLGSIISEYETEMRELLYDYEAFCSESDLIPMDKQQMIVNPASASYEHNKQYGVYYQPKERSDQFSKFIGLYWDKSIRLVGRVVNTVLADYDRATQELTCSDDDGHEVQLTENERERVIGAIRAAYEIGEHWDIAEGHRFTLVDEFFETDYRKITSGGMRGKTYFQLSEILNENAEELETQVVAEKLRSKTWG